jgi:hypothetical protein
LRFAPKLAYVAAVAVFFWVAARCHLPGQGFTYLLELGDLQDARYLPELREANHFELPDSYGYDAQFYAELAMRPHLSDPALASAVDDLPYRARRMLFSWTAWVFGGGDPIRALNAYAVQSLASWLLLAFVLLRWFPTTSWGSFLRWAFVMFSFGMCHCLRASLVDGPSLLLIAIGVALIEKDRLWLGAAVLGLSGLGRETNVLAGAALAPNKNSVPAWKLFLVRLAIVVLPIALWAWVLLRWLGPGGAGRPGNFGALFSGYLWKMSDTLQVIRHEKPFLTAPQNLTTLAALAVQACFFWARRRWKEPWWRIGASYSLLMAVLGVSVWAGYPPAAARVLLPMTLAFNILVPRGRGWWWVLLLGNLNVLASPDVLRLPSRESYRLVGPRDLRMVAATGHLVEPVFDERWYPPENSSFEFWRWSDGPSSFSIRNPQGFALVADITFELRSNDDRPISILQGGRTLWQGWLRNHARAKIELRGIRLEPGDTVWSFETPMPAGPPRGKVRGQPVFNLRNLTINLLGRADSRI